MEEIINAIIKFAGEKEKDYKIIVFDGGKEEGEIEFIAVDTKSKMIYLGDKLDYKKNFMKIRK